MADNGPHSIASEKKPGFQIGPWGCALIGAGLFVLPLSFLAGLFAIKIWLGDDRTQAEISSEAAAVIESGATPDERHDAYVTRAEIRGKRGDYQGAVDDLTEAIRIDPNIAATHAARGTNYLSLNEWEKALADSDKALGLGDRDLVGSISFVRAAALMALRRYEEAIAATARVPQSDPGYLDARYIRGSAFNSMGDRRRALREFNLILAIDPTYRDVWLARGEALLALNRAEDALFDFDMALRLNSSESDAKIHRLRGDALDILSRTEEAQEAYRRAREAESQSTP